jgi:tetratricopeptide (TPR) repeat protein
MTPVVLLALLALQDQPTVLPRPPKAPEPPSAYEQLVTRYQHGDFDGAVAIAARYPGKAFEVPFDQAYAKVAYRAQDEKLRMVQRRGTIGETTKASWDGWYLAVDQELRFLLAAMMLHTEAAMRTPIAEMPAQAHAMATSGDEMHAQLQIARTAEKALIDAERELEPHVWNKVKLERPQDQQSGYLTKADIERARHDWVWYVTLGYHARSILVGLRPFIESALQRYPKDPPLELCLGVYYERVARFTIVDESLLRDVYPSDQVAGWRHNLEMALDAYEQAARAPDLATEARLRMGRIRAQLKDIRRAREELEPLAASGNPTFIKYLALLILGDVDIDDRRPDAAAEKYRAAFELFPTSQAPLLALSRLSDQSGDVPAARDWLEKSFALSTNRRVDPWWLYFAPFIDMNALKLDLRKEVTR